jgi:enamine deaminase RidA (YjgF/YER057c/UK114 family)
MTPIRRIGTTGRLAQAVVVGEVVRTSGQVATVAAGRSVKAQTAEVLEKIDSLLAEAGTSRANLISAEVWLADMADFDAMNAVWDSWVDPAGQPVRVTTQSPMTRAEWSVAIAVTALLAGP